MNGFLIVLLIGIILLWLRDRRKLRRMTQNCAEYVRVINKVSEEKEKLIKLYQEVEAEELSAWNWHNNRTSFLIQILTDEQLGFLQAFDEKHRGEDV